jgi:hypothetical protein
MLRNFLSKVELVQPTYEEVVVIWRPLGKKPKADIKARIPKAVYDMAVIFDAVAQAPQQITINKEVETTTIGDTSVYRSSDGQSACCFSQATRLIFRPSRCIPLLTLFQFLTLVLGLTVLAAFRQS